MNNSHVSVWEEVLSLIKPNLDEQKYATWFLPLEPMYLKDKKLIVGIPSKFFSEWLEEHYHNLIYSALGDVLDDETTIEFIVNKNNGGNKARSRILPENQRHNKEQLSRFNSEYTFDTFVEGSCNQFARAVALAIAEKPGKTKFNPLLLWGGVGLGKTHLAHAIGIYALQNRKVKEALYVSSKKFTVDFISSIQDKKTKQFTDYFDKVDLLIVDDIEFFIGKESTQEQFFHTFNTLHLRGKQIVLTSDRPPREFSSLDIQERLASRFQNGLVIDIKPPELETRVAILQRKAADDGIELDYEVAYVLAAHITSNIRDLNGALNRLMAYAVMMNTEIDVALTKTVLKDLKFYDTKPVTIEEIQQIVADHFNINTDQLRDKTRKQEIVTPRQIAMYLVKELTNYSLKTTGLHFGGRDHTTVLHSINMVNLMMEQDEHMVETVKTLKERVGYSYK
jgi:chromosomal replication initiator protein